MPSTRALHDLLKLDLEAEVEKIAVRLKEILRNDLRRRGLVVALSGGIDSSVTAALGVRSLGPRRVFGLLLPERESSPESLSRGKRLAEHLGIDYLTVDITSTLESIGCYRWRDDAIRRMFPEYGAGWKNKISISGGLDGRFNHFMLFVEPPGGPVRKKRLGLNEYLQIVAATNFKQRVRKTLEYFHADRLNFAVAGTPNRVEYDQGFFVKNGDGAADVKPIAHLYKTQVYALAHHLDLPEDICAAQPTTDTYSMPQSQDEFYYALPYERMDLALRAHDARMPAAELARLIDLTEEQAGYVYRDIETKRRTTAALHWPGLLLDRTHEPVPEPE